MQFESTAVWQGDGPNMLRITSENPLWSDRISHCGPTGSPTVVRQDLPLWSDRISHCGPTGSPTVVRQDLFLEDQFLSDQSACRFENTRGPVVVYIHSTVVYVQ